MVLPTDYPALETLAKNIVKEKQKFERLVMTKAELLEMFAVRFSLSHFSAVDESAGADARARAGGLPVQSF